MQDIDFHIHGKPYSQDIWKNNDSYTDYLNGMYSNAYLDATPDESFMVIEILNKTVHYTYMRSKGIRDNIERPGSFFAITISLKGKYCSVVALYSLLDQIYNKIAKPAFLEPSKCEGELKYKVQLLEEAEVADQIRSVFENNIKHLNIRDLQNCRDTIRSVETRIVSLKDVDSPEFVDTLMKNRIVVSPKLDSAARRCGIIETEIEKIRSQKQTLSISNEQLKSEISKLNQENKSLSDQLNLSVSSTEKRYRTKLEQLQQDLANITRERDSLKQKIEEVSSSIEQIDQPFQKLTRQLAGRFSEFRPQSDKALKEVEQPANEKNQRAIWRNWLNSILLLLVLLVCIANLLFVMSNKNTGSSMSESTDNITDAILPEIVQTDITQDNIPPESENSSQVEEEKYDDWKRCWLNIDGEMKGDNLKLDTQYSLNVTIKSSGGKRAKVPEGKWAVYIEKGKLLNSGNTFTLTDSSLIGNEVTIEYIVDEKPKITRKCKIGQ